MNRAVCSLVAGACLALGVTVSDAAFAQEKKSKGPNRGTTTEKAPAAGEPVSLAATAERLARYGDEKKDPLALIMAARILQDVGGTKEDRKKESKGGSGESDKPAGADMTVDGLLARARTLAGGRQDIIAMADEVAKSGSRGASGGPKGTTTVVRGLARDVFTVSFTGGYPAAVGISGDGDTDLDLYVYDENGNLICRSDRYGDDELCRWNPRWTGPFRIEVRNLGPVPNRYVLRTN